MKRSDAIKVVTKRYKEEYCKPFEDLGYKIPYLTPAEIGWILNAFQDLGMLPPERQVDPKKKLGAAGPLKYYVNEWEDEDACVGRRFF